MRSTFNDPRVILPLALVAALFLAYRIAPGSFQSLLDFLPARSAAPAVSLGAGFASAEQAEPRAVEYMGCLLRERWLPERWRQFANLQRDPFVAGYIEPEQPELPEQVEEEEGPPLPLPEDLATYIVENIGLDEQGFFVRFGRKRIREGEMLGSEVVHQITVPGTGGDDLLASLTRLVPGMKLDATAPGADPPSAVIDGRLYLEGELVSRRPVLAVDQVSGDKVSLLDREGRKWWLHLQE